MAISKEYSQAIKKRVVKEFVATNKRSPTRNELRELIAEKNRVYGSIDQVGFSGFDIEIPGFRDRASASQENKNRNALFEDTSVLEQKIDNLLDDLENSHRGFMASVHRVSKLLESQEQRADNLLLLNSNVDVFVNGVEEVFDTQDYIVYPDTTASVENTYVTLGRSGYQKLDLSDYKITASAVGEKNILGQHSTSQVESLKEDDGNIWEYLVYSKYKQGSVSLFITIDLFEGEYVGDVKINMLPMEVNKKGTATLFYSMDGETYNTVEPAEQALAEEMFFSVGLEGVKKLQLRIQKNAADSSTITKKQYVYAFVIDSISIYQDKFSLNQRSQLIAGPYPILDSVGNSISYTKAVLDACLRLPPGTGVNFFLSNDGSNWEPVSYKNDNLRLVSFGNGAAEQSIAYIDDTKSATSIVQEVLGLEEIDFATEAVLNIYADEEFVSQIPKRSMVLKRNIVNATSGDELLGAVPGWVYDPQTRQYSTTVYVSSPEGRYVDIGPTTAYLNDVRVTGNVFIPKGYSVFKTSDKNWLPVPEDINTITQLKNQDPLYPYNHRYLISGYNYPLSFKGNKVYTGVEEYFGQLLEFLSPEEFAYLDESDSRYWSSFTIENPDGNWYFKIKVNKTDASWINEQFSADWAVQNGPAQEIWVKAELTTNNSAVTPVIESYKVRVI